MLDDLENVPWSQLAHAYGSADDVPTLLRELRSPDRQIWSAALSELYGNILHQGTVYEATPYAIPFLVEILEVPTTRCRREILIYLYDLAVGNCHLTSTLRNPVFSGVEPAASMNGTADEAVWLSKIRHNVFQGRDLFVEFLTHDDVELREAAVLPLLICAARKREIASLLVSRLDDEKKQTVRASIVFALSLVYPIAPELIEDTFRRIFRNQGEAKLVRVTAAIGLVAH